MNKKRKHPPLSPEQLALAPYGEPNCRLCQLPPDKLAKLHELKLQKKWTYKQIHEYVTATLGMGEDYTRLVKHFKRHVTNVGALLKNDRTDIAPIVYGALEESAKIKTNKDIEKVYDQLVKMTSTFSDQVSSLKDKVRIRLASEELDKEINKIAPLDLLERFGRLQKAVMEQAREVSALRAPKILVMQFLEGSINSFLSELSNILNDTCGKIQTDITEVLSNGGKVDDSTFMKVFQQTALLYKERSLSIKREQMARATAALSEIEKII